VLRTGCAWRHLPHDFTVGWSAAHKHFLRWCRAGIWTRILTAIRGEVRTRSGRRRRPTAAVVDSGGILVAAVVTPANVQDRAAFPTLLRKAKRSAPTIGHVWVDKGYTGHTVATAAAKAGVTVDVVCGPETRPRVHRPAAPLGGRTHQRLDQPLPPP
jgi:transposase